MKLTIGPLNFSAASVVQFLVPIRTAPGLNAREHPMARAKRVKRERDAVALCWPRDARPSVPCVVHLGRVAPGVRELDRDNLSGSLKSIQDEVARLLGVDDADPRVSFEPNQDRGPWGVFITIISEPGGQVLPPLPRPKPKRRAAKPRLQGKPVDVGGLKPTPAYIPPRSRRWS